MTNTSMIGKINDSEQNVDRLGAYYGFKAVDLKVKNAEGDFLFTSPHYSSHLYSTAASLFCKGKPGVECQNFTKHTCGFYSYNNVDKAIRHLQHHTHQYAHTALVKVAHFGTVVVAENGFRSSHQRITDILLPKCWNDCPSAGEFLVPHENGNLVSACGECLDKIGYTGGLSHAEYSAAISLEGYAPVKVSSTNIMRVDAPKILQPELAYEAALKAMDSMVEDNQLMYLQKLSAEINSRMDTLVEKQIRNIS